MKTLSEVDYLVLSALAGRGDPISVLDLAGKLNIDQSKVTAACLALAAQGWVEITEHSAVELRLGAKAPGDGILIERRVLEALAQVDRPVEISEAATLVQMSSPAAPIGGKAKAGSKDVPESNYWQKEVGQCLRWLQAKTWADKEGKSLILTEAGRLAAAARSPRLADELLVARLAQGGSKDRSWAWIARQVLEAEGLDVNEAQQLLEGRSGLVEERERKLRLASLTALGKALVSEGIQARREVNQLSSELLLSGEWRNVDLRPYDVTLPSEPRFPGKEHPLVSIFGQTRRVFLEMGFAEIVSPYVESSFWDFDALFQPQDHPARDMQDTFYIARPVRCRLPDERVVQSVRQTHEDGGTTGSVGWRYRWNPELAHRPVLRTHTTACTIRALAENPQAPRKVFCVGPVFRRETVDYKHLPVFHQVDGVIIDEQASFATLLGTLEAFYRKMGFSRFQFRPAFFPYTEPSVEIFVWAERKKDWVEMGGAGMFRPEVTLPFGCTAPVLAWGLGLERLAMFRYNLSSIGELYRARLSWLKETPLCR
jgi:phenylalanyl-tRNA synthetase alpha chain